MNLLKVAAAIFFVGVLLSFAAVSAPGQSVPASSDKQPPVITGNMITGLIPATAPYATLAVNTSEDALCKYARQEGMVFGSMETFTQTLLESHSVLISNLREGTQYDFYVKCSDNEGNTNPMDTKISFYVCYEIDGNCDRSVSLSEMNNFIDSWHVNSKNVSISRLIKGISLWKNGAA